MADIKQLYINTAVISLLCLTGLPTAYAQDGVKEDTSIPCLKLYRLQAVEIIDNKNIVFQTGINDYYLNTLPYACNGLRRNDGILYSTSTGDLCSVDIITVLDNVGPGFQGGPSCGLGKFTPVSKEEIKTIKANLKKEANTR